MITEFNPSRILVPTDFSDISKLAIDLAATFSKFSKTEIHLLHVYHESHVVKALFMPEVTRQQQEAITAGLKAGMEKLKEELKSQYGIDAHVIMKEGNPKKEIIRTAQEIEAGLIAMGTHGYSPMEELFIGSNTLKVISNAPCPVISSSTTSNPEGFKHILLPIDTSSHARQKVKFATQLAKTFQADIHAVALLTKSESHHEASLKMMLSQVKKFAASSSVNVITDVKRDVSNRAEATIDYAKTQNCDLIIIMADQDTEISNIHLGPYKQQILHRSHIPVITLQPKELSENTNLIMFGT
ncbi:MAG: universal stress protein [Sediminibacterium sp.]|nr:universal stress protein [Sediminibacterium sp.]